MSKFTSTFLVVNNPERFSGLYRFQNELDKKYSKKIYFDSSDFTSIIYGINDFYNLNLQNSAFDFSQFHQKMVMVHSLAYYYFLGTIHLLNPHMFEFLEKISPSNTQISTPLEFGSIDDIRIKLNLINPKEDDINTKDIVELLPFSKIEKEAEIRFKLMYLINKGHPKKRASYLKESKCISFDIDKHFNITSFTNTLLFKKIYSYLNEIEPKKNHNNFHDALALCQLQKKLDSFYTELDLGKEKPTIPILYGRGKLLNAAKKISQDQNLKNDGKFPFKFYGDSGEHLIVQNEDFFLVDALYNFTAQDSNNDFRFTHFYEQINDYYNTTSKSITNKILQSENITPETKKVKKSTEQAIHLDFFKKWWENKGRTDLKQSLITINDFGEEKLKTESFKYIDDSFQKFYNEVENKVSKHTLGLKYIKIAFERKFMDSLAAKHSKAGKLKYDLEQEFLTRFSYPLLSVSKIAEFIGKLYKTFAEDNINGNDELKIEMLSILQYVLSYSVLKLDENKTNANKEKLANLCVMLSILWIEKEYSLLNEFCMAIRSTFVKKSSSKEVENYYPNYHIALLHATSIIRLHVSDPIDYPRVEKILNCIGKKYNDQNYKAWLGQAFVYSKLWESVSKRISIPEIFSITEPLNSKESNLRLKYYDECSQLSFKSLKKIKSLEKIDPLEKKRIRQRRKYYSINLYIYIETLNRPLVSFPGDLNDLVKNLEGVAESFLDHERYQDTLARYYQRMAAMTAIEKPNESIKYEKYIKIALEKITSAMKSANSKNNKMDLSLYKALFNELKHMDVEGVEYFKNYSKTKENLSYP